MIASNHLNWEQGVHLHCLHLSTPSLLSLCNPRYSNKPNNILLISWFKHSQIILLEIWWNMDHFGTYIFWSLMSHFGQIDIVMCWVGPQALSLPSLSHLSQAKTQPWWGLEVGFGQASIFESWSWRPRPRLVTIFIAIPSNFSSMFRAAILTFPAPVGWDLRSEKMFKLQQCRMRLDDSMNHLIASIVDAHDHKHQTCYLLITRYQHTTYVLTYPSAVHTNQHKAQWSQTWDLTHQELQLRGSICPWSCKGHRIDPPFEFKAPGLFHFHVIF